VKTKAIVRRAGECKAITIAAGTEVLHRFEEMRYFVCEIPDHGRGFFGLPMDKTDFEGEPK
jgi:hypothetical protein